MNGKTKLAIGSSIMAALVGIVCFSAAAFADASSNTSAETNPEQALITKVADNLNLSYDQVLGAFDKAQQELSSEALQQRLTQAVENGTITQDEADQITAWMNSEPAATENLSQGWLNGLLRSSGNFSVSGTANLSALPDMGKGFHDMGHGGNFSNNANANMSTPPDTGNTPNMGRGFPGPSGNFSDNGNVNMSTPPDTGNMSATGNMSDMGRGFRGMGAGGKPSETSNLTTEEYLQKAVDNGTITQAESDAILAWLNAMPSAMSKIGPIGCDWPMNHF